MSSVEIYNLKGIESLKFQIPDSPGVYLLAGKNGSGKSTLLTCLHRIGYSNAFPQGLPCAEGSSRVDQYAKTRIVYKSPRGEVTYGRRRQRWIPSPYKHAKDVLQGFGFSGTVYAQADQSRLRVTADEVTDGNLYDVDNFVKDTMNHIFGETKFSHLKQLSKTRGRHSREDPYLLIESRNSYYSEKRFSSGELALLRLISGLQNLEQNSLVLLDEAELALHPEAQRRLLEFLKAHAATNDLIILVATHSTTLIANESANRIIMLKEAHSGRIEVVHPCYPAEAMESVDVFDSILGDFLILVEDEMAQEAWRAMCERALQETKDRAPFQYDVLPVGGYLETAKLAQRMMGALPEQTTVKAVLDEDAFDDTPDPLNEIMEKCPDLVHSLGFTPEVMFVEFSEEHRDELEPIWRKKFGQSLISIISSPEYIGNEKKNNPRKVAKKKFTQLVSGSTNPMRQMKSDVVQHEIIGEIVNRMPARTIKSIIWQVCHK